MTPIQQLLKLVEKFPVYSFSDRIFSQFQYAFSYSLFAFHHTTFSIEPFYLLTNNLTKQIQDNQVSKLQLGNKEDVRSQRVLSEKSIESMLFRLLE